MQKNLVLAVVLSMLVMFVWYRFFVPKYAPIQPIPAQIEQTKPKDMEKIPVSSAGLPASKSRLEKPELSSPITEHVLETPYNKITIVSQGAAIRHWLVKDENGSKSKLGQAPTDLVNHPSATTLLEIDNLPLSSFPNLNFVQTADTAMKSSWKTVMPNGVILQKTYVTEPNSESNPHASRFVKLILSFKNPKNVPLELDAVTLGWNNGLGKDLHEKEDTSNEIRVLAYPTPSKEVNQFKKPIQQTMDYKWVGIDNRYYLFAALPAPGSFNTVYGEQTKENPGEFKLASNPIKLQAGETKTFELTLYGGAKGYTHLKSFGQGLEQAVDFGYFGFLGKAALKAMYALHRVTGNYGWAIVILTCGLQVLVLPLSLKSYRSMAAMKKLQPKIQELQKRYKEDPKRMNQEMMGLYKASGTNPFGGCIPMILQIPIFWAFFTMLRNSFELRGAKWIWWIKDLSQQDPYYVLPILMGIGMLVQQKTSSQTMGDPTQAKLMMFMPVIFTFMFLKFPSGLVLYWFTNSLLSMATQVWCNRKYA